MTPYLLIGAVFVSGVFTDTLRKEFRTPGACIHALRALGLREDRDGYWNGATGNVRVRATCLDPHTHVIKSPI